MTHTCLNPSSSGHSLMPRGLGFGSIEGTRTGRFDRLMPMSKAPRPDDDMLWKLAEFMTTSFDGKGRADPDQGKPLKEAEPADENATIPAVYTYFGQFVDHDLTLDTTDFGQSQKDLRATVDYRTPALDLDCIYGGGPADQPYLYTSARNGSRHLLRLGEETGGSATARTRHDLLRLPPDGASGPRLAVIGDKRNDENKIVSQLQALMISFHNRIYEDDDLHAGITDPNERFENAVRLVRWHYQWVVLKDLLAKRLCLSEALSDFGPLTHPHLQLYDAAMVGRDYPFMPVEFSGAAYRLGHSMVRPSYSLSAATRTLDDPHEERRVPTFGDAAHAGRDLRGFGEPIDATWSIDWGFFAAGVAATGVATDWVLPQPSYRIDTRIGAPLADLPEFQNLPGARRKEGNLAYRNLNRGVGLGLPTGEEAAAALRIQPLTTAQIWSAGSSQYVETDQDRKEGTEIISRRKAVEAGGFAEHFAGRTPLWFYILREAEWYGCTRPLPAAYASTRSLRGENPAEVARENTNFGGQFLGPVGSRIVLETFVGILWHDPSSHLHSPAWRPHSKLAGGGEFDLGRLITYALGGA